ncbi:glycosyltransferase family 2 protein [Roseicitreum antarcticum]|uniref:Glycosyltransferase, GT2 family n=1 Tax=Roseicitreum antarcticum TaxID=564137 RepID=A0A1H2RD90_9RHOB|nr:glycosyltransferase [Roseicitreum antarcticum]SDW17402.1 Glycosyltransferase, GT2 family [Roseicitreum antarcticum]
MTKDAAPVSVIIVSRHRGQALRLCLLALAQQDFPAFEVIVVACPQGIAALQTLPFAGALKVEAFDRPNISAARNLGLGLAAGQVVAFIDDDACAEPTWLSRLVQPVLDGAALASGGFVRGRNGISLQWGAKAVDACGRDRALQIDGTAVAILPPPPGGAIRTEGTNMAFDRRTLLEIGGFDPAYTFYLDETDVNMRLAAVGAFTALVPLAQVHHGVKPSSRRSADRAPRDLFDIGHSQMVFLRKHAPAAQHDAALADLRVQQRKRLIRHLIGGGLEPRDIPRLMAGLEAGIAAGAVLPLAPLPPLTTQPPPFAPLPGTGPRPGQIIVGWAWARRRLADRARAMRAPGPPESPVFETSARAPIVTLLCLSPTWRPHRHVFHPDGYWLQTGGLWGRSDRATPVPLRQTLRTRTAIEVARLRPLRP